MSAIALEPQEKRKRPNNLRNQVKFTPETARAAALRRHEKARQAKEQAERAVAEIAAEKISSEILKSIDTWQIVRDDPSQPGSTRIQAADRFVDRALGPVGQKVEITDASAPWAELTPDAKRAVLAQLRASLEAGPT
jgi:acetyl-CoA acetyltransferase